MITTRNHKTGRVKITRGDGTSFEYITFATKTDLWAIPFWVPLADQVYSKDQYYTSAFTTEKS